MSRPASRRVGRGMGVRQTLPVLVPRCYLAPIEAMPVTLAGPLLDRARLLQAGGFSALQSVRMAAKHVGAELP